MSEKGKPRKGATEPLPGNAAGSGDAAPAGVLGSLPTARPARLGRQARGPVEPRTGGPRPVRAGAPDLPAGPPAPGAEPDAERRATPAGDGPAPPSGTELVTTAIAAAGELAHIGVSLGARVVRGALRRLPRP